MDNSLIFGDNLVLGLLRIVLDDLQKFNGRLLDLTVLDVVVCQYGLQQPLDLAWKTNLLPKNVYGFLEAVAKGYRIQCIPVLQHFHHKIEDLVRESLRTLPRGSRNRNDLITILKTLREATSKNDVLSIEDYHIVRDEAALESPYDPDFESEEYYEYEERLNDENYAKMMEYNQKLNDEAKKRNNQKAEGEWKTLFDRAKELAERGPLAHFLIRPSDQISSSWNIFNY